MTAISADIEPNREDRDCTVQMIRPTPNIGARNRLTVMFVGSQVEWHFFPRLSSCAFITHEQGYNSLVLMIRGN